MMPAYHASISAILGVAFLIWFQSWLAALICFLCGVFIDLDHHLDYFFAKGKLPWRYRDLVYYGATDKKHKLYLIFHSYEELAVLWWCIYEFDLSIIWIAGATGLTVHLLCDQIHNPLKPLTYFLSYRIYHNFDKKKLYRDDFFKVNDYIHVRS